MINLDKTYKNTSQTCDRVLICNSKTAQILRFLGFFYAITQSWQLSALICIIKTENKMDCGGQRDFENDNPVRPEPLSRFGTLKMNEMSDQSWIHKNWCSNQSEESFSFKDVILFLYTLKSFNLLFHRDYSFYKMY